MRSPLYVFGIVSLLLAAQSYALYRQWQGGFRPFAAPPIRVPLSWDMFAVEIERCGVVWTPPSRWEDRSLGEMRELGAPIEWDPIYNRRVDYGTAAGAACDPAQKLGTFRLRCFMAHEKEQLDEYSCPSG